LYSLHPFFYSDFARQQQAFEFADKQLFPTLIFAYQPQLPSTYKGEEATHNHFNDAEIFSNFILH
jgi:hypothetical protein